jgi:hypothetical protein
MKLPSLFSESGVEIFCGLSVGLPEEIKKIE